MVEAKNDGAQNPLQAKRLNMIKAFEEFNSQVQVDREGFIDEIVSSTEAKQREYHGFRGQLEEEFKDIVDRVNAFKSKISANMVSGTNQNGLLLHNEAEYQKCIQINEERMLELLTKNEGIWEKKI